MTKDPELPSFLDAIKSLDAPVLTEMSTPSPYDGSSSFYPGAGRQAFIDQVAYLTQFVDGVVLILGEEGVGKTRIAYALVDEFSGDSLVSLVEVGRLADARQVFAEIGRALELPFKASPGEQLSIIRTHIQEPDSERLNVIIDDAHLLDDQVLSSLLSLFQGEEQGAIKPFSLTLLGLPELVQRVDSYQLFDVRVNDLSVPPLSDVEMADYLQFKCRQRLASGKGIPTQAVLDKMVTQSQGRLSNVEQLWLEMIQDQPSGAEDGIPPVVQVKSYLWHIVTVALLLASLPLLYLYWGSDETGEGNTTSLPIELPPRALPQPVNSGLDDLKVQGSAESMTEKLPVDIIAVEDDSSVDEAVEPLVVDQSPAPQPELLKVDKFEAPVKPEQPVERVVEVPKVSLTPDERALLAENEAYYTLQILGVSSLDAAKRFRDGQSNRSVLRLFESVRQGKPWYVLVVGAYATKKEAREAIGGLPANQQKAGPWPRSYLGVQMEIKTVRGI